jgi:predicted ArsR family transcriptional regulator
MARIRAGSHAYGLARELGIKEVTVRSALKSLVGKGLVQNGTIETSTLGPARSMFYIVDRERARAAVAAEKRRREREIEQLSQRLAMLTKS